MVTAARDVRPPRPSHTAPTIHPFHLSPASEVHAIEEEKGAFLQALDDLSDGSDDETEGGELDGDASFDNSIEKGTSQAPAAGP